MSAGQKLLADLLGITNSAAESLSIQQVKDLEATTRETRGNDSKEQAEAPKMEGDDFDWLVGTTKKMGEKMMQEDDLQSSKSLLSGSLEDEFDESKCIKVKVPANLLKEKLSASDTSANSMLNSAESSVERQPIPEPSDFVRPGVFVSSAQKDVRQSTTNHSIGTKQCSKEHENKKHLQLVKRMREHPQILNSVGLLQGKENSMEQTCDAQPHKENEVVVLQFEQGTKKSDVQEKFKSRMSSAPIKKRVIPNIVAPSRETHPSQSAKLDAGQSSIADTKSVGQPQNTADQAVQYAALATSAAIAPFLQIQNALENQIASLVSTMSLAHSAEGNMKMTTQEDRLRELEDKIIDVLDKRMARIENVKDHATQRKMNATNEKKVPVSHGNEEFTLKQKLGNSGIAGELDHLRFKSAEPKSGHSVPVMLHDGPDNGYPDVTRYGATRSPSGLTSFDNDLQLIPTRDDQLVRKDTSGRTLHRQQNPILDPDIRHPLLKSCHSQPNMIPRSYPTLSHASDKALSPFSRRTKMQTNAVSPFLRNAKTQTSSSESSLVSEKSLLETPLPRSKIPVPFSRYTPKSEKGSRHEKRKVVTSLRNENQLLKGILKQSEEPRILDKENISPKTSSPKRIQGVPNRQMAKDNVSLERQGQNPEDIIRITRDRDLINEVSQKALEKEDIVRGIAPIDHYLTFPLRGNYSQFKDIPPTSTVKSIQRSGTVSKDDEGQTIKGESIKAESTRGHYVAASRVLSEIQERRNRLECNLDTLVRQRDQNRLYEYIDQHGSNQSDDIQRIRQEVDKKIEEISAQLQRETIAPVKEIPKMPEKVENQKKLSVKPNTRFPARGARQKIDNKSDTGKKSTKLKKKLEGKEKTKKKGTAQKPESALGSQLQDAITPTSYDPDLLAAIFGQRVHDHHRSTVRPPHIQFHSPSKVSSTPSRPQYTQEFQDVRRTTSPIYGTKDERGAKGANQTKYYFQPSDLHYGDEAARINYPSSGELVPVAQPLGKPRQDSKFRLAIPSTERPQTRHVGKTNGNIDTQSNIAVIEIKADEPRTPDWKKKAERLAIQNLPSLDIQTPPKQEENDREIQTPPKQEENDRESDSGNKRISLTPPKQEDYDGFQNYIACDDVIAPNEHENGSETEPGLEFRGQDFGKPREYNEPRFPPERPPCEMESKPATAEIQCKTSLEERAQEWVEQELLARIVNDMNIPQDPTIFRPHDGSIQSQSSSESSDEEEHDWIHEILGPSGMQLFVDAGISMNDQLLAELIREVVAEKIASLMGHPKKIRTPKREIIPDEPQSEAASHVSTPLQTPVYTPIQSEASSVHTPALSSFTEESSQEEELNPDKQKEDTIIEDEMPNKLIDAVKVSTPPQTPTITSSPVPFSQHVDTPLSSTREEAKSEIMSRALTPEASEMTGSVRTLDEFQGTELEYSETPDEEAPPQSPMISPRAAPSPLQPVIHVIPGPASPQHSSFTISSSTAVGTSLFEGISEGEKLCPDSIIPGLYSEGEFPVSEGQAILSALEDLEDEVQNNFKQLLQNLAGRKENLQNGVSDANGTATMKDTEDIEEDTLGEVSISEGEFLERDNAVMKLLTQIKSPPNIQSAVNDNAGINRDKSEGEVSIGEEQVDSRKRNQAGYRDWRKKKNEGIQRRILSVGEVPSSSNNGSRLPSYSIGEVRDLSATDAERYSKKQSSEESVRSRRPTLDNRTATRRKEVSGNSLPRYSGIDVRPRNSTQRSEVNVGQGELLESLSSPERDDTEGDPLEKPRTILVQSGNFGTASSFNFTDSLNEQKFGTLNEQDLKDMISDNSVDAGAVGRDSGPDSGADDVFDNRQITGAEKPPTKITLTIPSVADEDSEDDMTIEGDDGYSNEDVSNISL